MNSPHDFDHRHPDEPVLAYHNESVSTNASGLRPSTLRLVLRDKSQLLFAMLTTLLAPTSVVIAVGIHAHRQFFLAGFAAVLGLLALLVAAVAWLLIYVDVKSNHLTIAKGLLTPSVLSPDRRHLCCLANLSTGEGAKYYGVCAIDPEMNSPEQEIVCASTFRENEKCPDRWFSFSPVPLAFGCDDPTGIAACQRRIPAEYWTALRRIASQFRVPTGQRMLLLDADFQVLGEVSTSPSDEIELAAPTPAEPSASQDSSRGFFGGLALYGILALVLFGCSGLGGGVYSIVQMLGQDDADKLANAVRNDPIVLRELGGIDEIEKRVWDSGKRKDVFHVRGPLGTGTLVKRKLLLIHSSITLITAKGEWELDVRERRNR